MPMRMRGFLVATILMQLCLTPLSAQQKRPISQKQIELMALNSPLILEGIIDNVEVKRIDSWKLIGPEYEKYHKNDAARKWIVTEVTMKIIRVLAGDYDASKITFLIQEGILDGCAAKASDSEIMQITTGERALLAIVPNTRGTGENILHNRSHFFKLDQNTLIPYMIEYYLEVDNPLEIIEKMATERVLHAIYDSADVVCIGTVTDFIKPAPHDRRIVVSVDESLKGSSDEQELTINVSKILQPFYKQNPGYRVLLFLRLIDASYIPVSGINGFYVLRGDTLMRGFKLPQRHSLQQMRDSLKAWEEADK